MNKVKDFLIEIGVEELPAGCLENATKQLAKGILDLLNSTALLSDTLKSHYDRNCLPGGIGILDWHFQDELKFYYTPRRLAVFIKNIPDTQEDKKIEVFGPPKELSFNPDGTITQAGIGFANSQGVPVESIKTKSKGKKEVICCEKTVTGKPTIEILKSALPDIIKNIKFKKSMKWESTGVRFARPIRWFVALFGEDIIEFELAGVKSGRISQGLRGDTPISIDIPDKYEKLLEERGIIADPEKRKEHIIHLATSADFVQKEKLSFMSPYKLIEEVTNLVESPKIIFCKFDKKYLELLPPEVITTAMRVHQRYFALGKSKDEQTSNSIKLPIFMETIPQTGITRDDSMKKLSNDFIVVANTRDGDTNKIREGNENVLTGRLEDADFFYKEDLKTPLGDKVEKLKNIVWQAGLGSLYNKTQRLVMLSEYIAEKHIIPVNGSIDLNLLKESANLCKADLATNMIKDGKEFTSLEGLYGAMLAEKQHIDRKIIDALQCRVLPDICDIKKYPEGTVLAIADRLDTIVGAFILDKIPTGSSDPLGIKRAGNELIEIIIKNKLDISINRQLINKIKEMYNSNIIGKDIKESDFFYERIKKYLEDKKNIRYDIIRAVLSKGDIYVSDPDFMDYNPFDICERAVAFYHSIANQKFSTLIMLAKRIRNILKSPEVKIQSEIKETILQEPEERELFEAIKNKQVFDEYVENRDYKNALNWLLGLAPLINNFFDKILIMAEDINLRNNRLALINLVNSSFEKIADFSQIAE